MSYGSHADPVMSVAHFTDTHLLAGGALLAGSVDTDARLVEALERLTELATRQRWPLGAIIVSGDITDLAEPAAYRRAGELFGAAAERLGAQLVWTPGNHDERAPMAEHLLGMPAGAEPLDAVHEVAGLRIVALDSTLEGFHHGGLDAGQAEWLAEVLAEPAPRGTIVAMHHPPIPYRTDVMQLLEFVDDEPLAAILRGTDVRLIVSGHLHVTGGGTLAGIPVSVAGATSYVDDLIASPAAMRAIDDTQSFSMIEIGDVITHWSVPARAYDGYEPLPTDLMERIEQLPPDQRRTLFSRKPS